MAAHIAAVGDFFAHGKSTESGDVEPVAVENLSAWASRDSAVVIAKLRYASAPRPAIRSTFVLETADMEWKIRHLHFSFDPNES